MNKTIKGGIMLNHALRIIRKSHDIKAKYIAINLGVSPGYISEIETGKKTPNIQFLRKFAKTLGIKLSTIFLVEELLEANKYKNKLSINLIREIHSLMSE